MASHMDLAKLGFIIASQTLAVGERSELGPARTIG